MKHYETALKRHLAEYRVRRLGVQEVGVYKGRTYPHILPSRLRFLNLLEGIRAEVQGYLRSHPLVQLHRYFHHLNSSQALAFNLFYPFFVVADDSACALTEALGIGGDARGWQFECVPDAAEGTNVDMFWRSSSGAQVFCEVKLSEGVFGSAQADPKHCSKLTHIYRPRLQGLVDEWLLQERQFFRHYQLLRNISLLALDANSRVVFVLPEENEQLRAGLELVMERLVPAARQRVRIAYLEDVLASLAGHRGPAPDLQCHAARLREKYVPGDKNAV